MNNELFSRVILTEDFPDENLVAGDMGVVVEHHPATPDDPEGYEVEFFAGNGETVSVVSVRRRRCAPPRERIFCTRDNNLL